MVLLLFLLNHLPLCHLPTARSVLKNRDFSFNAFL
ncbi:hypothetical protein CSUI_007460, partial [Cystoisospora suis]